MLSHPPPRRRTISRITSAPPPYIGASTTSAPSMSIGRSPSRNSATSGATKNKPIAGRSLFIKLDSVYNYTKSINMKQPPPEGLRARKRREVRQRISNTATRLFLERGFDAVPAIKWFWPMVTSTPSLRARAQQHGEAFEAELADLLKLAGLAKDAPLIAAMVVAVWWFAWRKAVEQTLSGRALSRVRAEQRATLERAFAALNRAFPQ